MDYSARLDHLQLQSLERRRLIADLVLTYRIIFELIGLIILRCSRRVAIVLQLAGTHINCSSTIVVLMCENIFSERIIKVWNSLPPSVVSFESLLSFRNSLGNANFGIHTKY